MDDLVRRRLSATVKEVDDGERTLDFVISTETPDRDADTIAAEGWDLKQYLKNPVVLWGHNYRQPPIGRALEVDVEDGALRSRAQFTPQDLYPFGYMVYEMYRQGYLRAVSVGFMPQKYSINEERGGVDFEEQELLEYSAVPVPANPEALIGASKAIDLSPLKEWAEEVLDTEGLWTPDTADSAREAWEGLKDPFIVVPELPDHPHTLDYAWGLRRNATLDDPPVVNDKGIAPSDVSRRTADPDTDWSAPTLSDFTTESWSDLTTEQKRKITGHYAWAEASPPETFGGLKLPHHRPSDGAVVWRGVVAAMAALMGARGGANIPDDDRRKVHDHLASHYRQFDEEPPSLESIDECRGTLQEADRTPRNTVTAYIDADTSALDARLAEIESRVEALQESLAQPEEEEGVLELAEEGEVDIGQEAIRGRVREVLRDAVDHEVMQTTGRIR